MSSIAFLSMEVAVDEAIPTYAGGLGVLAGDIIRAAADLGLPMIGVTLVHREGYFDQAIDDEGHQHERPVSWRIEDHLATVDARVDIEVEGRTVHLGAWRYDVIGRGGARVPVYFLDSDIAGNTPADRRLTSALYGGDARYRLCQELLLGAGGLRMLERLDHPIARYHLNEGHSALLALELLGELVGDDEGLPDASDIDAVRRRCVFTTHTPVASGHDRFPADLARAVLGPRRAHLVFDTPLCCDGQLNMTYLALALSRHVNGVSKEHAEIAQLRFAHHRVDAITNGVHAESWASPPFQVLFDRHIPGWRDDNFMLRYAISIAAHEIWQAHVEAKQALLARVEGAAGGPLRVDRLTIGVARRAATYKRLDLILFDLPRLKRLAHDAGGLQIVFAGKAHPNDSEGKEMIRRIVGAIGAAAPEVQCIYLANYDIALARAVTSGVDLWLNTPEPPLEASGTSGMKAALNAVPSLSVLDGWWIEGCIEGATGWSIAAAPQSSQQHADKLYDKLEYVIAPLFYQRREGYIAVMRQALALNGSFFNAQRMLQQYALKTYLI